MSGGLHISCLADQFPYYAIKLLLGNQLEPLYPKFGLKATHIEQPVIYLRRICGFSLSDNGEIRKGVIIDVNLNRLSLKKDSH